MFSFERSRTMKLTGPVAVFAVLFSLPVPGLAQDAKPAPAKPAAEKPAAAPMQPAAKPEAPAAQPAPAVKVASGTPRRSRSNEDARSCLELATNMEIHKCAEPYR
jgi:hypothetical protein